MWIPHHEQHRERHEDVDEHEQGEEPAAERARMQEVPRDRLAEERQRVEPFGGRDRNVLRKRVPDHPVAAQPRREHQPQEGHAGEPRDPACATHAVEQVLAQQVEHHHQHQRVGGVAVEAPHDAARVPLHVGDALDRRPGVLDAGVEEDVEVDPGGGHDPVEEPGERAKLAEGIQRRGERRVENALHAFESASQDSFRAHPGLTRDSRRNRPGIRHMTGAPLDAPQAERPYRALSRQARTRNTPTAPRHRSPTPAATKSE